MKVAFVITGLGTGGAEMMLLKLLRQSASLRTGTVFVLQSGGELEQSYRSLGLSVEILSMHPGIPDPRVFWRLYQRLRRGEFNLVSCGHPGKSIQSLNSIACPLALRGFQMSWARRWPALYHALRQTLDAFGRSWDQLGLSCHRVTPLHLPPQSFQCWIGH